MHLQGVCENDELPYVCACVGTIWMRQPNKIKNLCGLFFPVKRKISQFVQNFKDDTIGKYSFFWGEIL